MTDQTELTHQNILKNLDTMDYEEIDSLMKGWLKEANKGTPSKVEKLILVARESEKTPCDIRYPWYIHYSYFGFGEYELTYRKEGWGTWRNPGSLETIFITLGGSEGSGIVTGDRLANIKQGQYEKFKINDGFQDEIKDNYYIPGEWENEIEKRYKNIINAANQKDKSILGKKLTERKRLISRGLKL